MSMKCPRCGSEEIEKYLDDKPNGSKMVNLVCADCGRIAIGMGFTMEYANEQAHKRWERSESERKEHPDGTNSWDTLLDKSDE